MTEYEYLKYQMNPEEMREWDKLAAEIKEQVFAAAPPDIPYEIQEDILCKRTMVREPFYDVRGYVGDRGYYSVQEGDRGHLHLAFSDLPYEEAKNRMIKTCAHDISYAYVTKNRLALRDRHKGLWRCCRIEDGLETVNGITRLVSHMEEQPNPIYDAEYDYRKYWFELLLYMEKRLLPDGEYNEEIACYQECLNHFMTDKRWIFDCKQEKYRLEIL